MSIRRYVGLCLGVVFLLAAPALAQTVSFLDANGSAVSTYLENTRVRVRVEDPAANSQSWAAETISVFLSASLSGDSESLTLTETGQDTGVFEGSMALDFEPGPPYQPGVLETSLQTGPPVVRDTLTAQYNSASDTAGMVAGRIELLDDLGRPAAGYTQGDLVRVRLEDHVRYNDPATRDSILVAVNVLAVSDEEFISLLETGNDTSLYEGSIPAALYATYDNDGVVGAPAGNQVHAQHSVGTLDEWLDVYAPLVGSRAEILDGSGKTTEFVAESSTIRLRAVDRTIGALTIADTLQVSVSSLLGGDQETVTLTETGAQTGVYEAGLPTRFNIVDPTVLGNGRLETGEDAGPPHSFDTITLSYNGPSGASSDTATTYGSETFFIDEWGNDAEIYALGTTVFIRVIDYNYDSTAARDAITAVVTGLTRGDSEVVNLVETGSHTGVFEGLLPIQYGFYNVSSGDGWLEADTGETIEVRHTDALGSTASADRAVIRNADIHFFDEQGRPTHELMEGGYASIRLYNFPANYSPWDVDSNYVTVRSLLTGDIELVQVTETDRNTGIFEGTVRLVFSPSLIYGNGTLEVSNSGSPDYSQDTVTVNYSDIVQATAATVGARVWLIDRFGQDAGSFAAGELVGIRVEDHNVDDPQARQTLQVVAITNPETGDAESVNALETGYATGIFEGTVPTWLLPYFTANDGYLQVQAGDRLEGRHVWLHSPRIATDSAVFVGSAVLFVDAQGQPVESYLEATTVHVRLVYAGGNVTPSADSVPVTVSTAISLDSETLILTETGGSTGVFTGSIPLWNPAFGTPTPNNYVLEPGRRTGPTELDTLTVTHVWSGGSASDTASMINSRTWFVDAAGNPADEYARDTRAYIRVEDHILDSQSNSYDVAQVTLRSLSTGDQETFYLQETGPHTGVFAGSMELDAVINGTTYPYPGDGKLQSDAGEEIEVIHEEWGVAASSSDRAWIEYASVEWIDESGASTSELLEGGVARLRVFDPYSYSSTLGVAVRSRYGNDQESVTLTETAYQSHIFEGTIQLRSVAPGGASTFNGILETSTSGSPEYRSDEVTAVYGGDQATAFTVPSRVVFIDGFGRPASSFAVSERAGVRVEDHNLDNPLTRGTVSVNVSVLSGETESVTLTETGYDTNLFEGSILLGPPPYGGPGDGRLMVSAGDVIRAEHGNLTRPAPTTAEATVTGSRIQFEDAAGQPADVYLESSRAWVRVVDSSAAGSITVTATLRTALGPDVETIWLTETAPSSGVFVGSIALGTGTAVVNDSVLTTVQYQGPPHELDTLEVRYNADLSVMDTAATISSRAWFVDAAGNPADKYARESRAYVRVEDHVADQPGVYNSVQVTLRSLSTGDQETLYIQQTARDGGLFAGSIELDSVINGTTFPYPGDGKLQADAGEDIEVVHTDWTGDTISSDRAQITYASIVFLDDAGQATLELLEGGVARLRVFEPYNSYGGTLGVWLQSLYGGDAEPVTLTETAYQSRVYEGTIQLRSVAPGSAVSSNGTLETSTSGSPEYRADEVTASYGGDQAVALTVPSRVMFIDGFGQVVSSFGVGEAAGVRVVDNNLDDPFVRRSSTVNVRSLAGSAGDTESLTLTETGYDTNIYEGSIATQSGTPANANGALQVQAGDVIEAEHGNQTTPNPTVARATMTGASVLFVDAQGQPAETYFESSRAYVRVMDLSATGSVTVTVQALLAGDSESLVLTQTGPSVFEGSVPMRQWPSVEPNSGYVETRQDAGPPYEAETLRVTYASSAGAVTDTAGTISSRAWFVDAAGKETERYARESRAYVRVEHHVDDNPGVYDAVQVTLRSLSTGDQETLYLQETARNTGLFAGSIELDAVINGTTYPYPGDGKLQADAGEDVEVVHTSWVGGTASSDRARITYASVVFLDDAGQATLELLEGGVARLRVFEPYNSYGGTLGVWLQSLYGGDEEPVTLTETAYQSRVYEGTVQLRSVAPGGAVPSNGTLETSTSGSPEYRADEVTAIYGGDQAVALTVPSRVMLVDGFGQVVSSFGVGDAVGVRVVDENLDDPVVRRSVMVNVRSLAGSAGDTESVTLTETGYDTNVYEGSIATQSGTPASGNGALQVQAGDVIEAEHVNATTPNPTVARATMTGASVLFVDAQGQPAETYFESSRAYVRVTDLFASGTSVTATVEALLGGDSESLTLTQTGPSVFEGSVPMRQWPSVEPNSGFVETRQFSGPPHEPETLRVTYSSSAGPVTDTAGTINSRTWFIDAAGNPTGGYARGSRAYVRVEDHILDQPGIQDTAQVTLRSLTTGDLETLTLQEISEGIFEGSLALETNVFGQTYPSQGDGKLQSVAAEEIEAVHDDMGFGTTSSDRTLILYSSVEIVDEVLEGGLARLRVFDIENNYGGGTVGVWVRSLYGDDEEPVTLTETAYQSHIYEGTVQLRSVAPGGGVSSNNLLETSTSGSPEYLADRITASYGGGEAVAFTVPSRAWFLNRNGQAVTEYAMGSTVRVRVADHNADNPAQVDSLMVSVSTPADSESMVLTETLSNSGVFEGSLPGSSGTPATADGTLQAAPGITVTAEHVNLTTPSPTRAQAVFSGNFAPLAVDDSAQTEEAPVTIYVLDNDSDPDSEPLQVTSVTQGADGTVTIDGQTVIYTPAAGFIGTDTFTYVVADPRGGEAQATVTVTVLSANEAPTPAADNVTTPEDTAVSIAVLANDTDPDNDPLEVIGSGFPSNGTAERQPDGTILYTPENNWSGQVSFTYMVRDPAGLTAYATVTVTVTPVNDPPVANDDTATTDEDTPVTIAVLANDSDPDGDVLDVTYTTGVAHGVAVVNADNTVTFTPQPEYSGTFLFSFSYAYTDGTVTGYADVTVTVNPVNDAPVANDDVAWVEEDSSVTVLLLDNDTDVEGNTLDVTTVTQGASGAVVLNANDTVTYTPNADFNGSDSFTYTVIDGAGGTGTATVTVTVNAANDGPVAEDDTATVAEDTPVTVSVLANDSDLDGDTLTVSAVTQGTNGTVAIVGSQVTYTPNADFNGSDSFTYTASDGNGGTDTATVTVTITPVNDAPAANDDAASVVEDDSVAVAVLGNDSDLDGDSLTITAVTQGANGAVAIAGTTVTYTPAPNFNGTDAFTYTVSDGNGGSDTATVSMTVTASNDALTAVDDAATVAEDGSVTVAVLANDTDPENDPLTVVSVTQGTNGTVAIVGNQVTYTPNADFNGTDSFTYTASDGNGGTGGATVTVTVTPVNDAPVAGDDTASVVEDGSVTISVLGDDTDVDGDTLTVSAVTQGTNGAVAIAGTQVTYTPATDFNGTDSFTYTVSDGNGGTDTATVTVTVGAANDAPVANGDSASTAEDTAVTVSVLTNDTDLDGDTLSVASVTQGANGAVTISGTDVVYTPGADFHGSDSFTYTASDGNGGTATATVTVTVSSVNDAPVAVADSASVAEDGSIPVSVLGNDTDVDGDSLSLTAVTQGTNGSVAISGSQAVYTPNANYNGPDSFTYTISDGTGGGGGSAVGTVTVTVTGANDAPVAAADSATVAEDGSAVVSVRSNDTDLDGDTLTITAVTQGANGSVTHNGSTVTYTPAANYNGSDAFTYTVSDGNGGTATASVSVTVTPVNDAPVAVDDTATTLAEVPVVVSVRANDSDIDSPALTVTAVTQGAHGTVAINAGATVTYTPAAGWVGPDAFTYTISDGSGGTATATVDVTVQAPPRVTGNLQVLYTFNEGSGTTVNDVSGVGTPLNLTISNASAVTWLPGALSLNTSVLVQSAGAATKVINASKSSNEVTVEAWVSPDNLTQTGPAAIASIAQNTTKRNVTLGQSTNTYNGQLKTSTTSQAGTQLSTGAVASLSLTHVVYTRSSTGAVRIYVNGTQVATSTLTGNLSGWSNYSLALGGEPNGARYWLGDMHLVAIYSRALTAAEARQNWLSGAN